MVRTVRFLWCDPYDIPVDARPARHLDDDPLEIPQARRQLKAADTPAEQCGSPANRPTSGDRRQKSSRRPSR